MKIHLTETEFVKLVREALAQRFKDVEIDLTVGEFKQLYISAPIVRKVSETHSTLVVHFTVSQIIAKEVYL